MVLTMSEAIVDRWLKSATSDMKRNNMTEIRRPCQRCKLKSLMKPDSGDLESHLLVRGFMDGYTQWVVRDEDVNGAARNEEGQQDNNDEDGREDEESPRHDQGDAGHDHEDEDAGADHEDQDVGVDHEDHQDSGVDGT